MSGRVSVLVVGLVAAALLASAFSGLFSMPGAQGQEPPKFQGSAKCKMCHADQHEAWMEMKHSKAFETLSAEQVATGKDEKGQACIQCHTTGYGQPTGFTSAEETPKLLNVGCESCHGAGGDHIKTMMMAQMNEEEPPEDKKISKNVGCSDCHNPHISYKKLYGAK